MASHSSGSNRSKFDVDLQFGQEGERWLSWLGTDQARVEVKTERDTWASTGNAVFEYECRGKPSGIAVTEADYWLHIFRLGNRNLMSVMFDTIELKAWLRMAYRSPETFGVRLTSGGDDNAAKVILVPITRLWSIPCHGLPFTRQRLDDDPNDHSPF